MLLLLLFFLFSFLLLLLLCRILFFFFEFEFKLKILFESWLSYVFGFLLSWKNVVVVWWMFWFLLGEILCFGFEMIFECVMMFFWVRLICGICEVLRVVCEIFCCVLWSFRGFGCGSGVVCVFVLFVLVFVVFFW